MKQPIPDAALDDRLAFVGTSGSGKTYTAKGGVERLLGNRHRVVIVDPLDVWFGLRLGLDGKQAAFDVKILGGRHADIPLNEAAGAVIGEAIATTTESCIIALSSIKTSAGRQRFMLDFLDALYERTDAEKGEPYHVVFDEADLWAPQKPTGREAMLCHLMEEIVRRGRVKGFIPWLISQRPAVLNKNVLSQADGLVAMKLTASQDRNAIKAWVLSTADEGQWLAIDKQLPTFEQGQGVVWMPARGILSVERFPANTTFDSSRTPKRGERRREVVLTPLNLDALAGKLATVEAEARSSDPAALKAEIARLQGELARKSASGGPAVDRAAIEAARHEGYQRGHQVGREFGERAAINYERIARDALAALQTIQQTTVVAGEAIETKLAKFQSGPPQLATTLPAGTLTPENRGKSSPRVPSPAAGGDGTLTNPQRQLLQALAWWRAMGHQQPTRTQVAAIAGWKPKGSNLRNRLTELSSLGMVTYPQSGTVELTASGASSAPAPDLGRTLLASIRAVLTNPQLQIFEALVAFRDAASRADLACRIGWEPAGSNLRNRLTELSQLELVEYPRPGMVALQSWVQAGH